MDTWSVLSADQISNGRKIVFSAEEQMNLTQKVIVVMEYREVVV